jgi:hypothetical protein
MKILLLIPTVLLPVVLFAQWEPDVIWDRSGATDSAHYGTTVFALGDQNDDSLNDWGVFAYGPLGFPTGGDSAYVEFFHGAQFPSQTPFMTLSSHRPMDFIRRADAVGDVNGDGYVDWFLDRYLPGTTPPNRIQIYFGGPDADTVIDVEIMASAPSGARPIGDFNGDGFDDIQIAFQDSSLVFFGGVEMDSLPDWRTDEILGTQSSLAFALGGDLNYDGFDDWCGADLNTGTVYVYLGSPDPSSVPSLIWEGSQQALAPLIIVHDLNGDGFDELLLSNGNMIFGAETLQPVVGQTVWINQWHDGLPEDAASIGDINLDGFGDLLMLNPYQGGGCWGEVSIHLGASWINPDPFYHLCGGTEPINLISPYSAAGLGDVNGDHVPDLLIGGTDPYGWEFALQRGRAIIIAGDSTLRVSADERPEIVESLSVSAYPNPFNDAATVEFELPFGIREVELTLYNLLGQVVHQEVLAATTSHLHYQLNANDLPSGVFILHCQANQFQVTTKLMHLR